jgi:hypothetical protein
MWPLLKAELEYNIMLFIIYLMMTIGFTFIEQALDDGGRFYVAMILFLVVQNWLSLKGKQKRDRFIARLPKSSLLIGSLRIVMILASGVIIIAVYKSMHVVLGIQGHANYPVTGWKLLNYVSIVLFGFSLYFIISDLVTPRLRELKNFDVIKERFFHILILLALLLQILGIVALMTKAPTIVTKLFDVLFFHNPFDNVRNIQIFAGISLILAWVSVVTFPKRRNYVQ